MGRALATAVVGFCLLGLLVGTATATDNASPLPDAGLDQTVPADATVHLDANGSRDPDGSLSGVRWTVETPSGRTLAPGCPTCRQTQFEPTATGRYNVTLTVTDDDGATRNDTLFVDVRADGGPSVALSGPSSVVWNRSATLTADVDAGDAALSSVAWVVDGDVVQRESLTGDSATATLSRAYTATGSVPVRAVAYDSVGRRATTSHSLTVLTRGGSGGGGGNSSSDDDCPFWTNSCLSDAVLTNSETGEQTVINANGEQGIQFIINGEQRSARDVLGDDLSEYIESKPESGPTKYSADIKSAMENTVAMRTAEEENRQDNNIDNAGGSGKSSFSYSAGSAGSSDGSYESNSGVSMADVTSASSSNGSDSGDSDNPGSDDSGSNDGFSWGGFSGGSYF